MDEFEFRAIGRRIPFHRLVAIPQEWRDYRASSVQAMRLTLEIRFLLPSRRLGNFGCICPNWGIAFAKAELSRRRSKWGEFDCWVHSRKLEFYMRRRSDEVLAIHGK